MGPNAVGKTNCIEALQLLCTAQSFKNPSVDELLQHGAQAGRISLSVEGDKRKQQFELLLKGAKKKFRLNGKIASARDITGILPAVLFYPDDLKLVKDAPHYRRESLDHLGLQLHQNYRMVKADYDKILQQRNRILKQENIDKLLFASWTESLVSYGVLLYLYRKSLFNRLKPHIKAYYESLSDKKEELDLEYVSSWGYLESDDKDLLHQTFQQELDLRYKEECARHTTVLGPHRDDVCIFIDGKDARIYGSQGQQRSVVLAWKHAELEVIKDLIGYYPLLLLDDVMSELDDKRRQMLMSFVNRGLQAVITTTHLSYFSQETLADAKVVHLDGRQ